MNNNVFFLLGSWSAPLSQWMHQRLSFQDPAWQEFVTYSSRFLIDCGWSAVMQYLVSGKIEFMRRSHPIASIASVWVTILTLANLHTQNFQNCLKERENKLKPLQRSTNEGIKRPWCPEGQPKSFEGCSSKWSPSNTKATPLKKSTTSRLPAYWSGYPAGRSNMWLKYSKRQKMHKEPNHVRLPLRQTMRLGHPRYPS